MAERIARKVLAEWMIKYGHETTGDITPEHLAEIKEEVKKRTLEWLDE